MCKALNYDVIYSTVDLNNRIINDFFLCTGIVCKTCVEEWNSYIISTGQIWYVAIQLVGLNGMDFMGWSGTDLQVNRRIPHWQLNFEEKNHFIK